MMVSHYSWLYGLLAIFVIVAGCGDAGGASSVAEVRDSVGVRVVDNQGRVWSDEEAWKVGEPRLRVGGYDVAPEYQLFQLRGGVVLPDGRVVVASNGSHDLRYYDEAGRFLRAIGGEGEGPGEFGGIWRMRQFARDSLLLWDNRNMRLSVHDLEGTFVRSYKLETGEAGIARFPGMEPIVFRDGTLLGLEWLGPDLMNAEPGVFMPMADYFLFDREGREVSSVGSFPYSEWFVGDETVVMANGREMQMRSPLLFGRTLFLAPDDSTFWMSTGGPVLSRFDRQGHLLQRVRRADLEPFPVTPALVAREIEAQLESGQGMNSDPAVLARRRRLLESMPAAEFVPVYQQMMVDTDRNLWARRYPDPTVEDPDDLQPSHWDVYEPEGRFLGSVELPARFEPFQIGIDFILGVQTDELDIEYLVLLNLIKEMSG